jgi:predicted dehydrogenase
LAAGSKTQNSLKQEKKMQTLLKVGLVGCGDIAGVHATQYYRTDLSDVELVACVDSDAQRLARFAQQFNVADTYSDIADVLKRSDIDVLDICTPPETHPSLIAAVAKAGKHVICEKPLGLSYGEAARAVHAAEKAGVKVGIMQNYRWRPEYIEARKAVAGGQLGRPLMASIEGLFHWNGTTAYRRAAKRMLIIEMTIHYIDLLRFVLGSDVSHVYAAAGRPAASVTKGETFAALIVHFDNGAIGTILNSGECQGASANWGGEAVIQLEDGTIYLNRDALYTFGIYSAAWGGHMKHTFPAALYGMNTNASFGPPLKGYFDALKAEAEMPVSGRDNLNTLAAALASYKSIETGQAVEISRFVKEEMAGA